MKINTSSNEWQEIKARVEKQREMFIMQLRVPNYQNQYEDMAKRFEAIGYINALEFVLGLPQG